MSDREKIEKQRKTAKSGKKQRELAKSGEKQRE